MTVLAQQSMTDPTEQFRTIIEAMTPGDWAVDGDALVTLDPIEREMERVLIADLRYFTTPFGEVNAAGIVTAVRLARFLASDAGREAIARWYDPVAWSLHDQCIANALFWEGKGDPGGRAPRDRQDAANYVVPSLAKADALSALIVGAVTDA